MKVIDPGHDYEIAVLDADPERPLRHHLSFVKRVGEKYPGNVGHHAGTTIQEVLRALIDRVKYVDGQIPDVRNSMVLFFLRRAIWLLEDRAAERHGRRFLDPNLVEPDYQIELLPTCSKCLHIGCEGECHPEV